ncbi:hypothetical protein SDC9_141514 [bioreactor metagenome]|uniref:Uncharacterized protein n=1 Tax=bioreactor metagenome TaxID=1076179 RepID=A0A645DZ01_9ZZZZ
MFFAVAHIEHLVLAAAVAVDRNTFATQLERKQVHLPHVVLCRAVREVHRFGHGVVRILLESRLHTDMVYRFNIVRGNKYLADMLRHLRYMRQRAFFSNLSHHIRRIKALAYGDFFKIRMHFGQLIVIHNVAHKRKAKERLYTA